MNRSSNAATRTQAVKDAATHAGFDVVGIASADVFRERGETTKERVAEGLMDGLPWFTQDRVERGMDPAAMLPGARSIISLALSHHHQHAAEAPDTQPRGRIARYAWGEDYHRVFARKVRAFIESLPDVTGESDIGTRWYTDTGPMLDRAVAERAGVGWFGKNTNILTSQGSWMLLAQIITTLELTPDEPLKKTCGACNICVDACPTGAIVAPYVLDNSKCISYLTIENRGPIPIELREQIGDWIFGCDVCQDVCPVNRKAQVGKAYTELTRDAENRARPELVELLELDDDGFRDRFRGSAVLRAKPEGMRRNVCIALGNIADPATVAPLARVLREDPSPTVRGHAAWALGRIRTEDSVAALKDAHDAEPDPNRPTRDYVGIGESHSPTYTSPSGLNDAYPNQNATWPGMRASASSPGPLNPSGVTRHSPPSPSNTPPSGPALNVRSSRRNACTPPPSSVTTTIGTLAHHVIENNSGAQFLKCFQWIRLAFPAVQDRREYLRFWPQP